MTVTEQNQQSFLAYNSWLGQRGLNKVSFATYTALFASNEPPAFEAPAAPSPKETAVAARAEAKAETKAETKKVETTYVPIEDPKDPALPTKSEAGAEAAIPQSELHLICWLDTMPDAASEELYTKIKKATCVPLSYMTSFGAPSPSESWQPVADALGAKKPALAIWGPCDHLPPEVEGLASSIWRMPHPSTFAEPGVKATFWQQLKELMATVAQHPEI